VLLSVYAGPTVKVVGASARRYLQEQWIADHGYVVVSLDGRGTPGHGRAWERAVQGNLIDIALDDQVRGLKLLGAKYPEMDMTRVGVNGWSFGGYFTAMATIRRPDVFACGVAGAPVTDWKNYDTFYTERYLQLPQDNPDGYRKSSVLTYAAQLERPLLIVHGVTDDNVYFVNSLQLCEALFEAGKPYEFLPMTGTHMAGAEDPTQGIRLWERVMGFLNAHLTPGS
jgi:dipeptidyl-peptidase-4